ncbi:hypothetical protein PCE1_001398 [Barthelona sp. PCE]
MNGQTSLKDMWEVIELHVWGSQYIELDELLTLLNKSRKLIFKLDLYSWNESLEEISTQSLKYLFIDYYFAVYYISHGSDGEDRIKDIEMAETYLGKYIDMLICFEILEDGYLSKVLEKSIDPFEQRTRLCEETQAKIGIRKKIEHFRELAGRDREVDDEILRDLEMKKMLYYVFDTVGQLRSLEQEKEMWKNIGEIPNINEVIEKEREIAASRELAKPIVIDSNFLKHYNRNGLDVRRQMLDDAMEVNARLSEENRNAAVQLDIAEAMDEALRGEEGARIEAEIKASKTEEDIMYENREWDDYKDNHARGAGFTKRA